MLRATSILAASLCTAFTHALAQHRVTDHHGNRRVILSPRQRAALLGEQIAHELHLSTETVRNHIRHILRALNAHSRLEAVAIGRREHLVAS